MHPPLEQLPAADEEWLCPACDAKIDAVYYVNEDFGTAFWFDVPWRDIFRAEAAAGPPVLEPVVSTGGPNSAALDAFLAAEFPSDDEDDEDFAAPLADADEAEDDEDDDEDEDEDEEEEEGDGEGEGKRRRRAQRIDYAALNEQLFGFGEAYEGEAADLTSGADADFTVRSRRSRGAGTSGRTTLCSVCREPGHNHRTCPIKQAGLAHLMAPNKRRQRRPTAKVAGPARTPQKKTGAKANNRARASTTTPARRGARPAARTPRKKTEGKAEAKTPRQRSTPQGLRVRASTSKGRARAKAKTPTPRSAPRSPAKRINKVAKTPSKPKPPTSGRKRKRAAPLSSPEAPKAKSPKTPKTSAAKKKKKPRTSTPTPAAAKAKAKAQTPRPTPRLGSAGKAAGRTGMVPGAARRLSSGASGPRSSQRQAGARRAGRASRGVLPARFLDLA